MTMKHPYPGGFWKKPRESVDKVIRKAQAEWRSQCRTPGVGGRKVCARLLQTTVYSSH